MDMTTAWNPWCVKKQAWSDRVHYDESDSVCDLSGHSGTKQY